MVIKLILIESKLQTKRLRILRSVTFAGTSRNPLQYVTFDTELEQIFDDE